MTWLQEFKPFHAPLRLVFVDPDTGYHYTARTRAELVKTIISYRKLNELPALEQLDVVVDNYLCSLPENCGSCRPVKLKRGFWNYVHGGISILKWVLIPSEHTASQAVADARARQCAGCKFNIFPDRGYFVRYSDDCAMAAVQGRRSEPYDTLGHCEVCSCVLKAAVWFLGDSKLTPEQMVKAKSVDCWKVDGK